MSSNYEHSETPLSNIYATTHSSLKSDLLFNLADYGFSDTSDTTFVKRGTNILSGWGTTAEVVRYAKDNDPLPFCSKESCPVPKYHTSGDHYIALDGYIYTSSQYVRYNSSTGYCEISTDKSNWSKIGNGFSSLFLGLQGGGGGGSGGGYVNLGAGSGCSGGAGGGGGAFILAYLHLGGIPDEIVTLSPGSGGSGSKGLYTMTGIEAGKDGGDSTLVYGSTTYLTSKGGKGGSSHAADEMNGAKEASGGDYEIAEDIPQWITILYKTTGKKGGKGAFASGYALGAPFGRQDGADGESFIDSDMISIPILKEGIPIKRTGEPWTTSYNSGCGQPHYNSNKTAYSSGGGGGGASVMGQYNVNTPTSIFGYGIGGYGGTGTTASATNGQDGKPGCVFIASCTKI